MKMLDDLQKLQERNDGELVLSYLYYIGEDVIVLGESPFPIQTRTVIRRIAELIKKGNVKERLLWRLTNKECRIVFVIL
jgi:hypothetical protein